MNIRAKLIEISDAFNAHDLSRIMKFFADDCVLEMPKGSKPYGSRFEGKHNMREGLAARFDRRPLWECRTFVDSGSQTGISKWCLTGTGVRSQVHYSAHWRKDNDNPALANFLKLLSERYPLPCAG